MQRYTPIIESDMRHVFQIMDEKSRRHYAAIEALKLGQGGIKYISALFELNEKTIRLGIAEIKKETIPPKDVSTDWAEDVSPSASISHKHY